MNFQTTELIGMIGTLFSMSIVGLLSFFHLFDFNPWYLNMIPMLVVVIIGMTFVLTRKEVELQNHITKFQKKDGKK